MERQRSKDVLAVMGLLCVNAEFRAQFFANPRAAAQAFVGELSASELEQIDDLGGKGELPEGINREEFVPRAKDAFGDVYTAYLCPQRPCPKGKEGDGDGASPSSAA